MIRRIVGIHFSPIGGTARMTDRLTAQLADLLKEYAPDGITTETYELMGMNPGTVELDDETVAVIGMPVYVGKAPLPALNALRKINASGTLAVAFVSYGARTYGNALYELQHHAEEQGFRIVGAGAFSVRYRTRGLRPLPGQYTGDSHSVEQFANAAAAKIRRLGGCEIEGLRIKPAPLEVAGRLPVHRISRISPRAAAAAQAVLQRLAFSHRESEWFL
jgi:hypothetical protein